MGKPNPYLSTFKIPAVCPGCQSTNLRVVRLTSNSKELERVSIDLYCATCSHRWQVTSGAESSPE